MLYSTYLGGSEADAGESVAVAAPNEIYIAGTSSSWDFRWHDNLQPFNGQSVAFVAKLDRTSAGAASLTYATPLGGTSSASLGGGAIGNAVATDSIGHVYLVGTGSGGAPAGPPSVSVPATFGFPPQLAGTTGQPQPITIINNASESGAVSLVLSGASVQGANSADFDITSDSCVNANVAPGASCAVQIAFRPLQATTCGTETGRNATLVLTDNAPGSPQTVTLSGTAQGFCFSAPSGQATTAPIAPGDTATYNLQVNSSGGFSGDVVLACSDPPPAGTCALSASDVNITPSAAGPFAVNVTTTASTSRLLYGLKHRKGIPPRLLALLATFAIVVLLAVSDAVRRRCGTIQAIQIGALLLALAVGLAACGGGNSGSSGSSDSSVAGTPYGSYTITVAASVTASSTTVTRTVQLPLTVN